MCLCSWSASFPFQRGGALPGVDHDDVPADRCPLRIVRHAERPRAFQYTPWSGDTYLIFTMPFTVWVMTTYFKSLPKELEEAAYVDGASPLTVFWEVLLPLTVPGLISTGLLAFIGAWNEFLFALTFTVTDNMKTVPVVISQFSGATSFEQPWGSIMAASMVVTIPLILLVMYFQNRIVAGLTAGAVKG